MSRLNEIEERCEKANIFSSDDFISHARDDVPYLLEAVRELRECLGVFASCAGTDPCYADHHGHCQEHNLEPIETCHVGQAWKLLEKYA